jgi:hypothetical protein
MAESRFNLRPTTSSMRRAMLRKLLRALKNQHALASTWIPGISSIGVKPDFIN